MRLRSDTSADVRGSALNVGSPNSLMQIQLLVTELVHRSCAARVSLRCCPLGAHKQSAGATSYEIVAPGSPHRTRSHPRVAPRPLL
jgi:hypothetical protein